MSVINVDKRERLRNEGKRDLQMISAELFATAKRFSDAGDTATAMRVVAHANALLALKLMTP